MKISILHISDLHRDPNNPISNEALLNSLIQDVENAATEDPAIPPTQIVIVSGDIIHGTGKDTENADAVLRGQYDEAEAFLGALADRLLGGDRRKMIIVPGNHDINFPRMFSALKNIDYMQGDDKRRKQLADLIWEQQSNYRWSWGEFKLYEIDDEEAYDNRLAEFMDFYARFYGGERQYSNDPTEQFDIFDFPDLELVVCGFNSCFLNDPWNRQGAIHPQAFSKACERLRNRQFRGRLRLAVWHHSTKGAPSNDDYMDTDFLQQLINHGYSLGFHGHQHEPELINEKFAFGGDRKVNALSASTLAGGEDALSAGGKRGYNRVVLDTDEWTVDLHVRQMVNPNFQNPIWGKGFLPSQESLQTFALQQPRQIDHATIASQDLPEAEALLREGNHQEAITILEPIAERHEMARRLLLEAFVVGENNVGIIRWFSEPVSPEEIIAVCDALWEEGKHDELKSILTRPLVADHQDPSVVHIRTKLLGRLGA